MIPGTGWREVLPEQSPKPEHKPEFGKSGGAGPGQVGCGGPGPGALIGLAPPAR